MVPPSLLEEGEAPEQRGDGAVRLLTLLLRGCYFSTDLYSPITLL